MTTICTDYRTKNCIDNIIEDLKPTETPFDITLRVLLENDYSPNTKTAMKSDIIQFRTWYEQLNQESYSFLRFIPRDFIEYRNYLISKDLKPASINRKLISLRKFHDQAIKLNYLQTNPVKTAKLLPQSPPEPKSLTQSEQRKLIREVEILGSLRDKVIIYLMLRAGLRSSEVVNLRGREVSISERKGILTIANSKRSKTRTVPLGRELRNLLLEELSNPQKDDYLFHGQRGRLTVMAITKIVEKYAQRIQLKVTPHMLRHSFAYNYLQANPSDIVGLAQLLGHSSINTTAIYTQHRMEDLQERVEKL